MGFDVLKIGDRVTVYYHRPSHGKVTKVGIIRKIKLATEIIYAVQISGTAVSGGGFISAYAHALNLISRKQVRNAT